MKVFRWSSYPLYLDAAKRPDWLRADRVLGALGVEDDPAGRAGYRKRMQKRVKEISLSGNPRDCDADWAAIRRGWYFGSEGFRGALAERMDGVLEGKRTASFSGGAIREHHEMEAERQIARGLSSMGITREALESMRKGAPEKKALVWLLRKRTVVKNDWISQHLCCGHPANIPGYVRAVEQATEGPLAGFRKILKSED